MDSNFLVYAALPLFFSGISFLLTFGFISYLRDRKITLTLKYGKGGGSKLQSKIYLFGGIIVFMTTSITIVMLYLVGVVNILNFIPFLSAIVGFMILGLVDDLYKLTHLTKSVLQIIIVSLYLFITHIEITELYVFSGLEILNGGLSYILTGFLILLFINMINIIDGINGLSSSLCVLAALFFSYHAFLVGNDMVVFLNIVVMGSLIAFIYFNVFSDFTIYMGDHGAYILGFYLVIHCFWLLGDAETLMLRQFSPMMVFALFSYPFIDLVRVIIIRVYNGLNPVKGDKRHLHYAFLTQGFSHGQSTFYIVFSTLLIILIARQLIQLELIYQVLSLLGLSLILFHIPLVFRGVKFKF